MVNKQISKPRLSGKVQCEPCSVAETFMEIIFFSQHHTRRENFAHSRQVLGKLKGSFYSEEKSKGFLKVPFSVGHCCFKD